MRNGDTERSKFVFGLIYNFIRFRMFYFVQVKLTVGDEKFVDLIENCRK